MPGGGMERGESPEQTAHRELAEETGLTASLGPVLGVFSRWYTARESARGEAGHVVGIVYEATALNGRLRTEFEAGSTNDARWLAVEDVRGLPHVELVDFVLDLIA